MIYAPDGPVQTALSCRIPFNAQTRIHEFPLRTVAAPPGHMETHYTQGMPSPYTTYLGPSQPLKTCDQSALYHRRASADNVNPCRPCWRPTGPLGSLVVP